MMQIRSQAVRRMRSAVCAFDLAVIDEDRTGGTNMIHILVVDDDKDLNRLVCGYLNDSGFETKGCLSVS